MACTGDYDLVCDLVCCGHSHQALIESIGNVRGGSTLMVNPGAVSGLGAPSTYAIGNLSTGEFRIL
jgi:predicted phosphodiesterase